MGIKVSLPVFCFGPVGLQSQPNTADPFGAMRRLDFLVGSWKGTGYFEFGPGQRRPFTETEHVQKKQPPVHEALGLASYDEPSKSFKWYAFRAGSGALEVTARVGDQTLEWGFPDPNA